MQIRVRVTALLTGALQSCTNAVWTLTLYTVQREAHKAQNYLFQPKAPRRTFTCALHHTPPALKNLVGRNQLSLLLKSHISPK